MFVSKGILNFPLVNYRNYFYNWNEKYGPNWKHSSLEAQSLCLSKRKRNKETRWLPQSFPFLCMVGRDVSLIAWDGWEWCMVGARLSGSQEFCFFKKIGPELENSRADSNIFHPSMNLVWVFAWALETPPGASCPAEKSHAARRQGHGCMVWIVTAEDSNCSSMGSKMKIHLLPERG